MNALDFYYQNVRENYKNDLNGSVLIREKSLLGNLSIMFFRKFTTQKFRLIGMQISSLKKIPYYAKKFGIDYLEYIIKNNPEIPTQFFPNADKKEIEYFLKVMLKSAIIESFNEEDFEGRWKKFEQTRREVGKNLKYSTLEKTFSLYGFKSIVYPDTGVFPDNYKLNIFKKRKRTVCIDAGGYIGDTAFIINSVFNPKITIVFEPDRHNAEILQKNLRLNKLNNQIEIVKKGVGLDNKTINFTSEGAASTEANAGSKNTNTIHITSIDYFVKEKEIDNVDFIKMDIEGEELNALKGAEKTIKVNKPDLMIAIYHKGEHFFELPSYLKKLVPEYNLRFMSFSGSSPIIERFIAASVDNFTT